MTRFQPLESYQGGAAASYRLLPFRFTALNDQDFVLTNLAGEYCVISDAGLRALVRHELPNSAEEYLDLRAKHFLYDKSSQSAPDLLALKVRTRYRRLAEFTAL